MSRRRRVVVALAAAIVISGCEAQDQPSRARSEATPAPTVTASPQATVRAGNDGEQRPIGRRRIGRRPTANGTAGQGPAARTGNREQGSRSKRRIGSRKAKDNRTTAATPPKADVELDEYAFRPATLRARSEDPLQVVNVGERRHNLTIPRAGVSVNVDPGNRRRVALLLAPGTYAVSCSLHGDRAMRGRFVITPR